MEIKANNAENKYAAWTMSTLQPPISFVLYKHTNTFLDFTFDWFFFFELCSSKRLMLMYMYIQVLHAFNNSLIQA